MAISIIKYNNKLIEENKEVNIIEYIKYVNTLEYHIDLSFMDELINYVERDEICIPHTLFAKYKILSLSIFLF